MIMVRRKKVCMLLATILVGIFMLSTTVFATENVVPTDKYEFYVDDNANIIDDELEKEMAERAITFEAKSDGIEVVVVTVEEIGDVDSVEYATDLYNDYEIGTNNMGVLIMLSVKERNIQLRIGDNMTKYLSDRKAGEIRDEGIVYFKDDLFGEGLDVMQKSTIEYIEGRVTSAKNETAVNPTELEDIKNDNGSIFLFFAIVVLVIGCAVIIVGIYRYFSKRKEESKKKDRKISSLQKQLRLAEDSENYKNSLIKSLQRNLSAKENELKKLQERYKRATIAYPDLDDKVNAIFAKEKEEADKKAGKIVEDYLSEVVKLECTRQNLVSFNSAMNMYKELTNDQKKYIPEALIRNLKLLREKSNNLQKEYDAEQKLIRDKKAAAEVQEEIDGAIDGIPGRFAINRLNRVLTKYRELTDDQKKYIADEDIEKINGLLKFAKKQQEEYEEDERRRNGTYYHHNGSFNNGGSFGGGTHISHGGNSGGHGAGGSF